MYTTALYTDVSNQGGSANPLGRSLAKLTIKTVGKYDSRGSQIVEMGVSQPTADNPAMNMPGQALSLLDVDVDSPAWDDLLTEIEARQEAVCLDKRTDVSTVLGYVRDAWKTYKIARLGSTDIPDSIQIIWNQEVAGQQRIDRGILDFVHPASLDSGPTVWVVLTPRNCDELSTVLDLTYDSLARDTTSADEEGWKLFRVGDGPVCSVGRLGIELQQRQGVTLDVPAGSTELDGFIRFVQEEVMHGDDELYGSVFAVAVQKAVTEFPAFTQT
jgi:hypothetical protein